MVELRIGTSGWIYKHWKGVFYPERLPQARWLEFYAQTFDTVEINFSFYRLPSLKTFQNWRARVGPHFRYAVKGSRYITHLKRLLEPEEHVALFFERVAGLSDRAGPILWQLPPDFPCDEARLDHFLRVLPTNYRHTVEFRHESWLVERVFEQLARYSVALCIPERPGLAHALRLTTDWTYLRFHQGVRGGDYTPEQLDEWAKRISRWLGQGVSVWAYFNNDWRGYAVKNALELRERLGQTVN